MRQDLDAITKRRRSAWFFGVAGLFLIISNGAIWLITDDPAGLNSRFPGTFEFWGPAGALIGVGSIAFGVVQLVRSRR